MKSQFTFTLIFVTIAVTSNAQGLFGTRQRPVSHFKGTQWYVGVTTGMNHSRAVVLQSFSELSLANATNEVDKDYSILGSQTGYSAGIANVVALTPYLQMTLTARYNNMKYGYRQMYHWRDTENEFNQLIVNSDHIMSLGYVEFPLQVRYAFPINRFKPFIQAGLLYGRQVEARKRLTTRSTDYASGGPEESMLHQQTSDISALYLKSHAAYTLGGGVIYNFGGLMLVAEANYQRGLHNIANAKTRYTEARHLAGLGYVSDDIKLRSLTYSVSFLFPLKFLTDKDFQPVIF